MRVHRLVAAVMIGAIVFFALHGQTTGREEKDFNGKAKPLAVGDLAPKLHVTKWMQGSEVGEFAHKKIYVVDFWAAWCDPAVAALPNLGSLNKTYGDKDKEYGAKAIAAGEGETEQVRKYIQQQIKKFDEDKKDK